MIYTTLRKIKMKIFHYIISNMSNVKCNGNLIVKKWPIIDVKKGAYLEIGKNVTIDSDNYVYGYGLFTKTKLQAKNEGARLIIGDNTIIHGSCIHATELITIGANCNIAGNCQIFDCIGHNIYDTEDHRPFVLDTKKVIIEDNVWIGLNSIILPGSVIRKGSVIAAGSIVRGEFEKFSLIGGNPAVFIKTLNNKPLID